jgi:hypothetical protein
MQRQCRFLPVSLGERREKRFVRRARHSDTLSLIDACPGGADTVFCVKADCRLKEVRG